VLLILNGISIGADKNFLVQRWEGEDRLIFFRKTSEKLQKNFRNVSENIPINHRAYNFRSFRKMF
jgi:hypothetical protein